MVERTLTLHITDLQTVLCADGSEEAIHIFPKAGIVKCLPYLCYLDFRTGGWSGELQPRSWTQVLFSIALINFYCQDEAHLCRLICCVFLVSALECTGGLLRLVRADGS